MGVRDIRTVDGELEVSFFDGRFTFRGEHAEAMRHYDPERNPAPAPQWVYDLAAKLERERGVLNYQPGELIPEGQRNSALTSMAGSMRRRGFDADAIYAALEVVNRTRCDPPLDDSEITTIANSVGRYAPDEQADITVEFPGKPLAFDAAKRIILRADEVVTRMVEWLWPGRIPLGKMTTFAGLGGLGKTLCLCDITSRVTTGTEWPDGSPNRHPGQVIFISGEDDLDDTIVPRLIACGADLSKVIFLTTEIADRFQLRDLAVLEAALVQAGPDVRLVVIDPPTAYLGGVDDHKNGELRSLLAPLKSWASRHHVSIVFNTHVNKPGAAKVEAMMRVMGSVAWVNAVRAAHMFTKDPDDPERRLFLGMKLNIGAERRGLAYKIVPTAADLAKIEWLGEVDTTADQAVNKEAGEPRGLVAARWLAERLLEKNEWESDDLFRAGRAENINRDAIFEAKKRLGLTRPRRVAQPNGSVTWVWWVPENWTHAILGDRASQLSQPKGPRDSCDSCDDCDS